MTSISSATYAVCAGAFAVLIALMFLRGRVSGPGVAISVACALTVAWATDLAIPGWLPSGVSVVLDSLRLSAWLILIVALTRFRNARAHGAISAAFLAAVIFCLLVIAYEITAATSDDAPLPRVHDFLRIGLGIGGLLAVENLLRNTDRAQRRSLSPFCLAVGGMFAFELFLYAERLMTAGIQTQITEGRGLVGILAVPLLALAMARHRDWRVDIHVSRTVVLHTAALVASGVFFLLLAVTGILVRELGGVWGPKLQLLTLVGSAVVLVSIFGLHDVRIPLKQFIARHFFSHRFDYRAEWRRFVDTVSHAGAAQEGLSVRVIRALAQIVDSPSGTLWRLDNGHAYVAQIAWNVPLQTSTRKIAVDDNFVDGFRGGSWIQLRSPDSTDWPFDFSQAWLAIPLLHNDGLIAFVVLSAPPYSYSLDWEVFDLLRAAGRQAASYLAEESATRELFDSRLLREYSERFAFVIHDIKNLASRLGMVVANARVHIDDADFRRDMLQTIEDTVARMNRLLAEMRAGSVLAQPQLIEPDAIIADVARELSAEGAAIDARPGVNACCVAINGDQLRSMLFHLVNNAREASRSGAPVVITSRSAHDKVIIDVVDRGVGMDENFIREELFRPLRSTKEGGFGIGAYQIRELLRLSGGELDVISTKGVGTVMRMTFPAQRQSHLESSAA